MDICKNYRLLLWILAFFKEARLLIPAILLNLVDVGRTSQQASRVILPAGPYSYCSYCGNHRLIKQILLIKGYVSICTQIGT